MPRFQSLVRVLEAGIGWRGGVGCTHGLVWTSLVVAIFIDIVRVVPE